MDTDLDKLSALELASKLKKRELSSYDLTSFFIKKIAAENPDLNAYVETFTDALDEAKAVDISLEAGEELPAFAGVPIAIKDNILIKDKKCSASSKMLENYTATYDATVIDKLKKERMIFLGRTNMDEFAMGGSTENSAFGVTKNPHDHARVAGGSSGGSAAVVGGGLAPLALGSDTGGSIRQPASFCGAVGLKPTYGRVSRSGLMAMASSLDQIGPITKTVADAEAVFYKIAGYDAKDSTSLRFESEGESEKESEKTPSKMTIGVPTSFIKDGVDEEVLEVFNQTLRELEKAGHTIKEITLPNIEYALASYYVIMPAESSSNLGRFDGLRYGLHTDGEDLLADYKTSRGEGFGPEVRRRIILGTYVLSAGYYDAYYGKATALRSQIRNDYVQAFSKTGEGVDIIMTPTAPTPAWKIGEKGSDPVATYLADIFTVPANLAGIPAMSVPAGLTKEGLPIGVQVLAGHGRENNLFALGKDIEKLV